LVEQLTVNQFVAGSSPAEGAILGEKCYGSTAGSNPVRQGSIPCSPAISYRGLAQSGSAPALGAGGHKFESYSPDQYGEKYVVSR
jgi:hypothetical protein